MIDSPTRGQIHKGCRVRIETKADQGTGRLMDGVVKEILTSSQSHPYGIKVELEDGHIGRVKALMTSEDSTIDTLNHTDLDKIDIPETENALNEFKEYYQYDAALSPLLGDSGQSKTIEKIKIGVRKRLAIAVCSFGNDRSGGYIYLGIKSDGTVTGLESDKRLGGFLDYGDEFANHIRDSMGRFLDDPVFLASKMQVKFRVVEDKTICIIHVMPSDIPLYVKDGNEKTFFVRGFAPRAEKLDLDSHFRYIRDRFPNYR